MKHVLLVTRPIVPPWDEASKNFAHNLALHVDAYSMTLLTDGHTEGLPKKVRQLPVYSRGKLDMRQKFRLMRLFPVRNNYDIIHFMLTPNKMNAYTSKTFLKGSRAKTIQTIVTLREDRYSKEDFRRILFADLLITYSDYAKRKLETMGFSNVTRIYPGIDLGRYQPKAKDQTLARALGIEKDDIVVTYPGEYTRLGATDDLVAMLPELLTGNPRIKFVFACRLKNQADRIKKEAVKKILSDKGMNERVVYADTVRDMPALYNTSDVVLFPVRSMVGKFDVPLSVIEAMACEKPVIVSDLPILSEFSSDKNSVVVRVGDTKELVARIEKLCKNPALRSKIGKNARAYALSTFRIDEIAQQYERTYNDLLSS